MTKLLPVNINFVPEPTQLDCQETPENGISCAHTENECQQKSTVVFGTTFLTIFFAEIGDKTQFSTMLMSAESHKPLMVFIGSAIALIATSLLGVLIGSWMASKFSPRTIEVAAGVMLLAISVMLIGDILIS